MDNHQFYNARAFDETGAARMLAQQSARPEDLRDLFGDLMLEETTRREMQAALTNWHAPRAADEIAQAIIETADMGARPAHSASPEKRGGLPHALIALRAADSRRLKLSASLETSDQTDQTERSVA
jgi:hypothetical protein